MAGDGGAGLAAAQRAAQNHPQTASFTPQVRSHDRFHTSAIALQPPQASTRIHTRVPRPRASSRRP
eukprot:6293744-Prymnesium_polylepis.1